MTQADVWAKLDHIVRGCHVRLPAGVTHVSRLSKPALARFIDKLKAAHCGAGPPHNARLNPKDFSRLKHLSTHDFHVFHIPHTKDSLFEAAAQAMSIHAHHFPMDAHKQRAVINKFIEQYRVAAVEAILPGNNNATNLGRMVLTDPHPPYQAQFHQRNGTGGVMSWNTYATKMPELGGAAGSDAELQALALAFNVQIHVYTQVPQAYTFQKAYGSKQGVFHVLRFLRSGMHFDVLWPSMYADHQQSQSQSPMFWNTVERQLLNRQPSRAINSAHKARKLFDADRPNKEEIKRQRMNANLPNANNQRATKFNWGSASNLP